MNAIIFSSFLFLTLGLNIIFVIGQCPLLAVTSPCVCYGWNISCNEVNLVEVEAALGRISINNPIKNFTKLSVVSIKVKEPNDRSLNSVWSEIPANFTSGLTFKEIIIDMRNQKTGYSPFEVHIDAFKDTRLLLKKFSLLAYNLSNSPNSIYDVVNSMANLEEVHLCQVPDIPSNAIKLEKVKEVDFSCYYKLSRQVSISDNAFYQLKNVERLKLVGNGIDDITLKTFRMQNSSKILRLDLSYNYLDKTSFGNQSLEQFNRPTKLVLSYNQMTYFPENVFKPFLDSDKRNSLHIFANPLNCSSCRNAWLVKGQNKSKLERYKNQVILAICDGKPDGPRIFNKKFDHCK